MQRLFLSFAAVSGFISVCLGAFAAHGLKHQISPESFAIWQTGVQYQMYHALALLLVGLLYQSPASKALKLSGLAFILGSFLFSGSLYAIALGAPKMLGIITPMGGLSFLAGWLALFVHAVRR
ncbi:DUF423 domain-containing protein [Cellvibrio zantedeschiae]|uniref:DUF423 domain-containing protein n=1 Tax=Cellvibrio zantedeschiae TaxID=1237077 RepID=A0ABQ3B8U1_9GAMM|nr:DUF423 domain-containing protein [Cellvibrio zantedeschiae]GGY84808.1 DUF423 domain-containing protein [Cellvibrio zantedeschiae]